MRLFWVILAAVGINTRSKLYVVIYCRRRRRRRCHWRQILVRWAAGTAMQLRRWLCVGTLFSLS